MPFAILDRKQPVLDRIRGYLKLQDDYDRQMLDVPRLKASGLTIPDIAAALGTSVRPIRARLEAKGISSLKAVFTQEDRQEMVRLYELGYTVLQIHAAIGKGTEQAVRFHLQRLGCIKKNPKPLVQHPQAKEIVRLHRTGMPAHQIAKRVQLGETLICKILRQEGISLVRGSALKLTPELLAFAEQELQKGTTLQSVADEIGVSTTLIRFRLKAKSKKAKTK